MGTVFDSFNQSAKKDFIESSKKARDGSATATGGPQSISGRVMRYKRIDLPYGTKISEFVDNEFTDQEHIGQHKSGPFGHVFRYRTMLNFPIPASLATATLTDPTLNFRTGFGTFTISSRTFQAWLSTETDNVNTAGVDSDAFTGSSIYNWEAVNAAVTIHTVTIPATHITSRAGLYLNYILVYSLEKTDTTGTAYIDHVNDNNTGAVAPFLYFTVT